MTSRYQQDDLRLRPGSQRRDNGGRTPRPEEDIMHPMFVKLFIETDAGDLLAYEEEQRRRARRARHNRSRTAMKVTAQDVDRRPDVDGWGSIGSMRTPDRSIGRSDGPHGRYRSDGPHLPSGR